MKNEQKVQCIPCCFDDLFRRNLIHILERIFQSLDFKSLKRCFEVCHQWNHFLNSALTIMSFRKANRFLEKIAAYKQRQIVKKMACLEGSRYDPEFLGHLFTKPQKVSVQSVLLWI